MRSRRGLNEKDTYVAIGSTSRATAEQLLATTGDYPDWVKERYLQLPKNLPASVGAETDRIINDRRLQTPYEKAKAIEECLRQMPYDLAV